MGFTVRLASNSSELSRWNYCWGRNSRRGNYSRVQLKTLDMDSDPSLSCSLSRSMNPYFVKQHLKPST